MANKMYTASSKEPEQAIRKAPKPLRWAGVLCIRSLSAQEGKVLSSAAAAFMQATYMAGGMKTLNAGMSAAGEARATYPCTEGHK
jgi:hypothetical protein